MRPPPVPRVSAALSTSSAVPAPSTARPDPARAVWEERAPPDSAVPSTAIVALGLTSAAQRHRLRRQHQLRLLRHAQSNGISAEVPTGTERSVVRRHTSARNSVISIRSVSRDQLGLMPYGVPGSSCEKFGDVNNFGNQSCLSWAFKVSV